jgi:protein O-mannosyl-transferase
MFKNRKIKNPPRVEALKALAESAGSKSHNCLQQFLLLFLSTVVFVSFTPVLQNSFINFDDDTYVTENTHIQNGINHESITWAFTKSYASNWHPLTWFSHMLDWYIFKNNPQGHHLASLLLHIINTMLLFQFLTRLVYF